MTRNKLQLTYQRYSKTFEDYPGEVPIHLYPPYVLSSHPAQRDRVSCQLGTPDCCTLEPHIRVQLTLQAVSTPKPSTVNSAGTLIPQSSRSATISLAVTFSAVCMKTRWSTTTRSSCRPGLWVLLPRLPRRGSTLSRYVFSICHTDIVGIGL